MAEKDNLLLSFPRSGNTWVRYFMEFISRRPTSIGTVQDCQEGADKTDPLTLKHNFGIDVKQKCILIKRHRADHGWDSWTPDNALLVFLLRDPREAIIRHHHTGSSLNDCVEGYLHCLEFYDKFQGRKCFVGYEDLLKNPFVEITKVVEFLGVSKEDRFIEFFENFDFHRNNSVKGYGASATGGDKNRIHMHKRRQPRLAAQIMSDLKSKNPELFDKYLSKYK